MGGVGVADFTNPNTHRTIVGDVTITEVTTDVSVTISSDATYEITKEIKDNLIAVRVSGTRFQFHHVPVSEHMLNAMKSLQAAQIETPVYSLRSLDFLVLEERKEIIFMLDELCRHFHSLGRLAEKRPSISNAVS